MGPKRLRSLPTSDDILAETLVNAHHCVIAGEPVLAPREFAVGITKMDVATLSSVSCSLFVPRRASRRCSEFDRAECSQT